jgi:adenine-specific DNA-methyltransferase
MDRAANSKERPPDKATSQTLTGYAEALTSWYVSKSDSQYRKNAGQYFTPAKISGFMARQYNDLSKKDIRILDPGAGIGILESSFCEYLISAGAKIKVTFDLYENDPLIIPILLLNVTACKETLAGYGLDISFRVFEEDFVLSNASGCGRPNGKAGRSRDRYDFVIANPPYYKLRKTSPQLAETKDIVDGPPNIYPLFMAVAAELLHDGGQMTILTPRSYCSGWYYRKFRNWFLRLMKPYKIHVFESRREIFKEYGVLQENIILNAEKTPRTPKDVMITASRGAPSCDEEENAFRVPYDRVIAKKQNDLLIQIPTSKLNASVSAHIDGFKKNLNTLGFRASTGPVVPFRAKHFLSSEIGGSICRVPLIWMHNIVDGAFKWPTDRNNKPPAIQNTLESKTVLTPNKNYVLVKRFSTREGKQRISAAVYLRNAVDSDHIGIENHVNYIHKQVDELTADEAYGIAALLNSKLYNIYFQVTNGNTQVNASEINSLPLPPLEIIRRIGHSVKKLENRDAITREHIIMKLLKLGGKLRDNPSKGNFEKPASG